jgi:hypothetical protein
MYDTFIVPRQQILKCPVHRDFIQEGTWGTDACEFCQGVAAAGACLGAGAQRGGNFFSKVPS